MRFMIILTALLLWSHTALAEVRSTWLQPAAFTPQQWSHTRSIIVDLGLTDVYVRAPAIYAADGVLLGGGAGSSDNFRAVLAELNVLGINVHAWITNGRRLEENQLHPGGWAASVDREKFIDFSQPDEQKAQAVWVTELLRQYPDLSGVSHDYIRALDWSDPDFVYTEAVTETICHIRAEVQLIGKYLLSAAIYSAGQWPSAPNYQFVQQDPVTWINRNCVDWVTVMQYAVAQPGVMQGEVASWQQLVDDESRIHFAGAHYFPAEGVGESWGPLGGEYPYELAAIVPVVRAAGMGGFSIYTLGIGGRESSERILTEVLGQILAR